MLLSVHIIPIAVLVALSAAPAWGQDRHDHDSPSPSAGAWVWSIDGQAFIGYNYQYRRFRDFDAVESQNWLMATVSKSMGPATALHLNGMFSLEPFTLRDIGSPQVFQTGETFQGAPLIDYQHPHDLIMNLGGDIARAIGTTTVTVAAYAVGPAPIGPEVFMHRASAAENPQSPLSHHYLDSTHVTPGVVTVAVERAGFTVEAGVFHGQEPDEDRLDLDTASLDSFGARAGWADGPWSFQLSAARLETPERTSPYDATRLSASASFFKGDDDRSIAWTAAFGQNREVFGNLEAYLFEGNRRAGRHAFYARAEWVAKDILDAGFHPIGTEHVHRQSNIGALTLGYVRDFSVRDWGRVGVGGDVTGYRVPANLKESYGSPVSFHAYVRLRGRAGPGARHH